MRRSGSWFICQSSSGKLRTGTRDGENRTSIVAEWRRKLDDTVNVDILERLGVLPEAEFLSLELKWHKVCYSIFTSETKQTRLTKQHRSSSESTPHHSADPSTSTSSVPAWRSNELVSLHVFPRKGKSSHGENVWKVKNWRLNVNCTLW